MIVRRRSPYLPPDDIDLGPSAARMKAQTFRISAATVPNMIPTLKPMAQMVRRTKATR